MIRHRPHLSLSVLALAYTMSLAACSDSAETDGAETDPPPSQTDVTAAAPARMDTVPDAGSATGPAVAPDAELSASSFRLILPAVAGRPGVLYGSITGGAVGDRLTGVAFEDVAADARVGIHETRMSGGRMSMEERPALDVPAGETVTLEEGGWHGMVFDLPTDMKAGGTVPVRLTFETAGPRTVDAAVEARGSGQ